MRKMVLNGYVLYVLTLLQSKRLSPCKGGVQIISINLNRIAVRVNICGGVYPEEIKVLQKDYVDLCGPLSELLEKLSEVVAL